MKEQICKILEEKSQCIFDVCDRIWDTPELGYHEYKSSATLKNALKEQGFHIESNVAGIPTAFKASYGSGHPVIGFLAEYDSLANMSQEACKAERSPIEVGGNGHGCGHNAISAASFASAITMKEMIEKEHLEGTVVVFGCPAEEQGCGKSFMARAGVFDGVDVAISPDPKGYNDLMGTSLLANIQAEFRFTGVASHAAAAPEMGRSALDATSLMIMGIQFLREHAIQEARIHHAYLDCGGTSPNVVQDTSSLLYYIRAPRSDQTRELFERVKKVAYGAAMMTDTDVEISIKSGMTEYVPNHVLGRLIEESWNEIGSCVYSQETYDLARRMAPSLGCDENADLVDTSIPKWNPQPSAYPGSTDVGDVSFLVPTVLVLFAGVAKGTPPHSFQFVSQAKSSFMHEGIIHVAKVIANAGIKLLKDPALVAAAWDELNARGVKYECLIPEDVQPEI